MRSSANTVARRGALFASAVVCLIWLHSSSASAIPAPVSDDQLEQDADLVVTGKVVSVQYLQHGKKGRYMTAHFLAKIRVSSVDKGDLRVGAIVPLRFISERWIGSGRKPVGRTPRPSFYACEKVRLYLYVHKGKGSDRTYSLAAWNAKRSLELPSKIRSPTPRNRVIRCVKGRPR